MIFTDTQGNVIPDIEFRIPVPGLIRALIDNGTLRPEDVTAATDGRVLVVIEPEVVALADQLDADSHPEDVDADDEPVVAEPEGYEPDRSTDIVVSSDSDRDGDSEELE